MIQRVLAAVVLAAFFGMEFVFRAAPRRDEHQAPTHDRGTTVLLMLGYALALLALAVGPTRGPGWSSPMRWAGLVVAVAGLVWRAWAMKTLGVFYTQTLRTVTQHRLVTTGPYRWIRHPGYLGSLMVWGGAAVASGAVPASLAVLAALAPTYIYRIAAEEQMLQREIGDEYAAYVKHTWRLLPLLF
jgi:protein-S-isoprenylcysteine O-methyltransferase Ste14